MATELVLINFTREWDKEGKATGNILVAGHVFLKLPQGLVTYFDFPKYAGATGETKAEINDAGFVDLFREIEAGTRKIDAIGGEKANTIGYSKHFTLKARKNTKVSRTRSWQLPIVQGEKVLRRSVAFPYFFTQGMCLQALFTMLKDTTKDVAYVWSPSGQRHTVYKPTGGVATGVPNGLKNGAWASQTPLPWDIQGSTLSKQDEPIETKGGANG